MKKYLNLESFTTLLSSLKKNKPVIITRESQEDGSLEDFQFESMTFRGVDIILWDTPVGSIDILQDTPVAPMEDYMEGAFDVLTSSGEYKLFIEE